MVRDYGTRAAPRGPRAGWIGGVSRAAMAVGVAGPILALAAIPTLIGLAANAPDPDDPVRAAGGVPCRAVSQAEFERGWRDPPRAFLYRGARFARRRGDADCAVLHAGPVGQSYPACRFDAPAALAVTVAGRSAYYDIGPGLTAQVEAKPGGVRCVVTGRHRLPGLAAGS